MRSKQPHNVQDKFNLLVIDFPYFSRNLAGIPNGPQRFGFFVARRKRCFSDEWAIERQFFDRQKDGVGVTDSNFNHRPSIKVKGITALIQEFQKFEHMCLQNGMTRHERAGSSYTFGACLPHALCLLGYSDKSSEPANLPK